MQMCFFTFIYFNSFKKEMFAHVFLGGNGRFCSAVFCENLVAISYVRTIGVCGYEYIHGYPRKI